MMRNRRRRVLHHVALAAMLGLSCSMAAAVPPGVAADPYPYGKPAAQGYGYADPWGVRAYIDTARPAIRDGWWSEMSVWMQDAYTEEYYMEVGWARWAGQLNGKVFTSVKDAYGYHYDDTQVGDVFDTRIYSIDWSTEHAGWEFRYYGRLIHISQSGVNISKVGCGGVTSSTANAIGIASCRNAATASGRDHLGNASNWVPFGDHYEWSSHPEFYWVQYLAGDAWRVGGRN